ncbi:amidohydrolase family protein [Tautonia plasticadhaerens]|uniref:Amidohydrolase n=1 Tax=Tautonia plasticadhaerens TaxID=2527974 RepID=A0A518HE28_9BACT|nr:amidohydrolase family protein [Tautonia plasticadhaerens]QDV39101.1 Amidohydrolase [Tautonia plasticadhaerens]
MTGPIVDVNVNLGHWPARRVRGDEIGELAARLRANGVAEAWSGSLDGLLHKDLAAVNACLADACRQQEGVRLVPFGSVNPMLPDWEEDLRRCVEEHGMPGIRLHPNYHGYALDDPEFARLLELASGRRLIVAIALAMEDERMMHPMLRVPPVEPGPLAGLVPRIPGARLLLLNALRTLGGERLGALLRAGDVSVEIATLEGVGGVARLLDEVPLERVLFGSHAPFFYFEAAPLKLRESDLSPSQLQAVRHGNVRRLLPASP